MFLGAAIGTSPAYTTATRDRNVDKSAFSSEYSSQKERLNSMIQTNMMMDNHLVHCFIDDSRLNGKVSFLFLRTDVGEGGLLRAGMMFEVLFLHFPCQVVSKRSIKNQNEGKRRRIVGKYRCL